MSDFDDKYDIFVPQKNISSVDVVINNIKSLIINKKIFPGDKLPSEEQLSKALSVSRGSVREAMKILSAFGIIEIKRGDGTYVSQSMNKKLFDPLFFNMILNYSDMQELVELRKHFEKSIVDLVIDNANKKDLTDIKNTFECMNKQLKKNHIDINDMIECEIDFHMSLGKATNNKLFEEIYAFILELFIPTIKKTYKSEENIENAYKIHKKILDSIISKDKDKAFKAVKESIDEWRNLSFEK